MSTLRIKDAPLLPNVDGSEKIPTGGRGDYSVSVDQIKTFAQGGLPQKIEDHINDTNNPHQVTKEQVGLGNVDNTSDVDKPTSTATQEALDLKANQATTYTKTEVDGSLSLKADKSYVDSQDSLKADKTYVDSALSGFSNGAAKFYPTLAAANADIANIALKDKVEVGEVANGGTWYKATAGATTLTKSAYDPLTQAKADATIKSITAKQEAVNTIIDTSSNIFNDATSVKESKVISVDGSISVTTTATDWAYSDFIAVTPNTYYYLDGFRHIAFYDSNKNFISRSTLTSTSGSATPIDPNKHAQAVQTLSNAFFIRLNYRTTEDNIVDVGRKVNVGSVSLPYEPFRLDLKEDIIVPKNDDWIFGGENIADNAIDESKVSFIETSNNLFDASSTIFGKVISVEGLLNDSSTYAVSDFIAVEANTRYTMSSSDAGINAFIHVVHYDANKNFINRVQTQVGTYTFTTASNVAFVRLNINTATGAIETKQRMLNIGDAALPYQKFFKPTLKNITIPDAEKNAIALQAQVAVQPQFNVLNNKTSVINQSNNLFNHTDCLLDYVIRDTGAIEPTTSGYAVSNFIAVESGQKYTISSDLGYRAFIHTVYYDADKNFISRNNTYNEDGPLTITIPSNVKYVRFNVNNGRPDQRSRMFNKGDTALPFEFYGFKLSDVILSDDIIEQINSKVSPSSFKFVYDLPVHDIFETDATWTEFSNFRTITAAEVYQMYDGLMLQHPDNITKHMLTSNASGQEIAYYRFKPTKVTGNFTTKIPKVFLCCSVHGMEHTPPLATFLMLREMYNNWQSSPLLEALRFNAEFIVIPVANPYGWNRFDRLNPNGVDINRNFPVEWAAVESEGSAFWQGPSPASEIETQNIMSVFESVKDIDIFYDFHNFNGTSAESHPHLIWVSPIMGDEYMARMSEAFVSRMTRIWRKKYEFIPPEPYFAGRVSTSNTGGMAKNYAGFIGTKFSATFEFGGQWWIDPSAVPHDTIHKRTTMEALTNWILINLNELKRM